MLPAPAIVGAGNPTRRREVAATPEKHVKGADEKVGSIVMYIIAITLVVCTAGVLIFYGVDAMPYDWIGVIGAALFAIAALATARFAAHG